LYLPNRQVIKEESVHTIMTKCCHTFNGGGLRAIAVYPLRTRRTAAAKMTATTTPTTTVRERPGEA
jgi:hypothetical protein